MAIPNIKEQDVLKALEYIDKNGVPSQNQSTKYELVTEDGKKYPPKYVIAVAAHLATGVDISTDGFNAVEAKSFLMGQGFDIEVKQEKFELTITADKIVSTDERFTMDNISLGDHYKPLSSYFQKANGDVIKRNYSKGERVIPIKQCHALLVRFLKSKLLHYLWKAEKAFLSADIAHLLK